MDDETRELHKEFKSETLDEDFNPTTMTYHLHKAIWLGKKDAKTLVFMLDMFEDALYNPERYTRDYGEKLKRLNEIRFYRNKLAELAEELY